MAVAPLHGHFEIALPDRAPLMLGRVGLTMGIVNVTPDSFSDGGRYRASAAALAHIQNMIAAGADIIDIGGESTRPGAVPVSETEELERVLPVFEACREAGIVVPLSIDTSKAEVAAQAIAAGAVIVNDVSGLENEPALAGVVAARGAALVVMHWTHSRRPGGEIVAEVASGLRQALARARAAGIPANRLVVDPGFGFAKSLAENYALLKDLGKIAELGYPLLVGTSRKSMIGAVVERAPEQRIWGTVATTALAYGAGAHIFRVHDIAPNRDALRVAEAVAYGVET